MNIINNESYKYNYTYDDIGNRETIDNDLLNNFVIGDPVATVNGVDYTYDDNGILTPILLKNGNTTYDYDYENRLEKVKRVFGNSSTTVTYSYDPFGRRVEREANVDGTVDTTKYLYDGEDVIAEYDGSNTLIREFVHGPGIDEALAVKTGGNWYYYHADGLGSVINLSDSSGNKIEGYGYDSFGNLISDSFGGSYTYTGREWDADAGLYYYRGRFADLEVGQFISKDPIGFAGGDVNLYSYVQQNPVNWIDPWGLWKQIVYGDTHIGGDPIKQWQEKSYEGRNDAFGLKGLYMLAASRIPLPPKDFTYIEITYWIERYKLFMEVYEVEYDDCTDQEIGREFLRDIDIGKTEDIIANITRKTKKY